jgi:3-methyl-2-oxobutanoate hydroxymethyltransferase
MVEEKPILSEDKRKVTTYRLQEMKQRGEKIAMLTAYDYSMAGIIDQAGMDVILVGDSASNVMAGNVTTLPITLDQMIYHGKSVMKAVKRAMVVVDMPFGSYQGNPIEAVASAVKIMKETQADAVKLEGGKEILESVTRILSAGIPIMGHLGLTPQSINKFGTYTVRAREEEEANRLIDDMLGINKNFSPRFLRRYANLFDDITKAVQSYIKDVKTTDFPSPEESY